MRVRKTVRLLTVPPGMLAAVFLLALLLFGAARFGRPPGRPAVYLGIPLEGRTVAIDPSHGGIDPGTHHNETILEKEVVLAVALELERYLRQAGAAVVLTRSIDEDVSRHITGSGSRYHRDLQGRVKLINASGADLFISLHVDSCVDPDVRGAITVYNDSRPENRLLAECIQKHVNPVVRTNPQEGQYFHQKTRADSYYILNEGTIPGVILEMGFMTSPADRELLIQKGYRKRLAEAIFMGIVEYLFADGPPDPE